MADTSTTSSRLLTLLSLLQTRRDWSGDELAGRLGVSARTVRRDVERLRDLGYPVDSLTGPAGGYRLRAGSAMPPLLLEDEEAVAIAVGLRAAAGTSIDGIEETSVRALVKLEQVLPAHLRRRVNALQTITATLPWTGPSVDPQALTTIASSCRDRECLRFAYNARDGKQSRRVVEPHSLVNLGRRWYLVAWDCGREDWRSFRLDRLERPAPAGKRFTPRALPVADPAAFVQSSIQGMASRYSARVTLRTPVAAVGRTWGGEVVPIDDETCEYRTSDESLEWLAVRIGMLGVDFVVHEPPELVEHFRALARRFAAASASTSGPTSGR